MIYVLKCSINPVINPKPVYSYYSQNYTLQNKKGSVKRKKWEHNSRVSEYDLH
jgi:hypothetical protein